MCIKVSALLLLTEREIARIGLLLSCRVSSPVLMSRMASSTLVRLSVSSVVISPAPLPDRVGAVLARSDENLLVPTLTPLVFSNDMTIPVRFCSIAAARGHGLYIFPDKFGLAPLIGRIEIAFSLPYAQAAPRGVPQPPRLPLRR